MTEQEAIEKIHSVYPTGCKNGLENMRALMAKLGNPQERLTMVHVAGTNGKGSCCAMTERVLSLCQKEVFCSFISSPPRSAASRPPCKGRALPQ